MIVDNKKRKERRNRDVRRTAGWNTLFIFFVVFWLTVVANHREESGEVQLGQVWFFLTLFFLPGISRLVWASINETYQP